MSASLSSQPLFLPLLSLPLSPSLSLPPSPSHSLSLSLSLFLSLSLSLSLFLSLSFSLSLSLALSLSPSLPPSLSLSLSATYNWLPKEAISTTSDYLGDCFRYVTSNLDTMRSMPVSADAVCVDKCVSLFHFVPMPDPLPIPYFLFLLSPVRPFSLMPSTHSPPQSCSTWPQQWRLFSFLTR